MCVAPAWAPFGSWLPGSDEVAEVALGLLGNMMLRQPEVRGRGRGRRGYEPRTESREQPEVEVEEGT